MTLNRRPFPPAKTPWPKIPAVVAAALAAVALVTLSAGVLLADPSAAISQARKKLVDMVTGDISRSLAVESGEAGEAAALSGGFESTLTFASTFSGSAVYGMGRASTGTVGTGIVVDTYVIQRLSPDVFGGPMAGGVNHTLAIDKDGNLWITGLDNTNQYGDGPVNSSSATISQQAQTGVRSVAAGTGHSLVVFDDGTVMGSGEGSYGQLGDGRGVDTNWWMPVKVSETEKVIAFNNNCYAITDRGELYAFGQNAIGGLGVGTTTQVDTPKKVISGGVVDVAAGSDFALVLMADGSVMAMGTNNFGQFGDGTTDSSLTPKLVVPSGVKAVAAGVNFSMFLMADGSLQGVGQNSTGQLGLGDTVTHYTRTTVATDVALVSTGREHTLYVTKSGALMGMGNSGNGQLGLGDFTQRLSADTIRSSGVTDVYATALNSFFMENTLVSIEIKGLATAYAGATANYRCFAVWGDGRRTDVTAKAFWSDDSAAAAIELNSGILDLSAAQPGETVRLSAEYFNASAAMDVAVVRTPLAGAAMFVCGQNSYSQLGLDTTVPQNVLRGLTTDKVISLAGGITHSLYVREDGALFTMGGNAYGQLGTGDTVPRSVPIQIGLDGPAVAVGAGGYHSLVVLRDGSLYAMGLNSEGQLGNGNQFNSWLPIEIQRYGVVRADGGYGHSTFLTADGALWTMGRNDEGQLGTGDTADVLLPFQAHAAGVTDISADGNHTLFTTDDTAMWGMGSNQYGQLGMDSSVSVQLAPATLVASGVAHMAAGRWHSLYAAASGDAYSSGLGVYGQLGHGDQSDLYGFTQIGALTDVNRVYAFGNTSFFRTGTLTYTDTGVVGYSWYGAGNNYSGQFANGTWTAPNTTPVLLNSFTQVHQIGFGYGNVLLTRGLPGDIDGDGLFTLRDVIRAQQIMAGNYNGSYPFYLTYTRFSGDTTINFADIDGDGKIGLPEVQHVLRRVGGF